MQSNACSIENYIRAKDGNRPALLRQAFSAQASLEMVVLTSAISFPGAVNGLPAITDTLVRSFSLAYENIYTFCIGPPPQADAATYTCKWLVGMAAKGTGELRVGCGQYRWQFAAQTGLVEQLAITITHMQVLAAGELEPVMDWLQGLDYPWCSSADISGRAPDSADLAPILGYIEAG
jgi:hypothetical protein